MLPPAYGRSVSGMSGNQAHVAGFGIVRESGNLVPGPNVIQVSRHQVFGTQTRLPVPEIAPCHLTPDIGLEPCWATASGTVPRHSRPAGPIGHPARHSNHSGRRCPTGTPPCTLARTLGLEPCRLPSACPAPWHAAALAPNPRPRT